MGYQQDFTSLATRGFDEPAEGGRYLGPALVREVAEGRVRVMPALPGSGITPDDAPWAEWAMPFAYEAVAGDTLLVIGEAGRWYVIGVLQGSGHTRLVAPGDLSLSAPAGRIELEAADGVGVRTSTFEVICDTVSTQALEIVERCQSAARWVARLFELRAGQARTVVDDEHLLEAKTIVAAARENAVIDGEHIHLG